MRPKKADTAKHTTKRRFIIPALMCAVLAPALILAVTPPGGARAQTGGLIQEIIIEGVQRIEPDTARSYMVVRPGDAFDERRIDRSLKSLFSTGLFADVAIRREGSALIVSVVENPIINRVAFEGNDRIGDDQLGAETTLRPRVIYTRTKVQNDVQRILAIYRAHGRFSVTVEPKVIRLEQNRVDLAYEISEGPLTEIRNIRFVGNREYSDSGLREEIKTKETRWWRFISSDDVYDPDRLTLDRELLRKFYLSEGYADFRVLSAVAELTPNRRDFFITFVLEEGEQYDFGEIAVDAALRGLDIETLNESIEIESGDTYDADMVDETVETLTEGVGSAGYAFVEVRPRVDRDRENRKINITFEVGEGPRVYVERIEITGNVRTEDKVIRREFKLVEGDAFNASKLRRSRESVRNLGFFKDVAVERVPGSAPDKTVVNVEVEEQSTGSFSIGAGYSTDSGALADIGFKENNLLGKGQKLSLRGQIGQKSTQMNVRFTEPYFLDRKLAASVEAFRSTTDNQSTSSYDLESTGGALSFGYPLSENLGQTWSYNIAKRTIDNVPAKASLAIREQEGSKYTSKLGHGLFYDTRDSAIDPTEGYTLSMNNEIAGLGGDVYYMRNTVGAAQYFPLADEWTLLFRANAGYIFAFKDGIRVIDRFRLGGSTLRGFAASGVGPRDKGTDDALGGEWRYYGTAETTFPLGLPNEIGLNAKAFIDFGSVGGVTNEPSSVDSLDNMAMRMSMGAGLVWTSPLGPIGVDFAFPLMKEDFDKTESFRINFGTVF
ncbi:MAG: outer membrane protein assembly factor BamA [Rhodospirillales bacterium]